jgi:hypothetical protein
VRRRLRASAVSAWPAAVSIRAGAVPAARSHAAAARRA